MIENNLCPQHYVNMVVDYVNSKMGSFLVSGSSYTAEMIVKYCISQTRHLDKGDEARIDNLVYDTLEQLRQNGYVSCRNGYYKTKKINFLDCFITIEDRVKPMNITADRVKKLNEINLHAGRLQKDEDSQNEM